MMMMMMMIIIVMEMFGVWRIEEGDRGIHPGSPGSVSTSECI